MLEPLKNFLINVDFSLQEIPNQDEQIGDIYQSYFQTSKFSQNEIQICFTESYRLVKKHIDSLHFTLDSFEQSFQKDFDDYFLKINTFLPNKELTYIFLTQVYQFNVQKLQLQKLIDRYENIELEHFCLKQEYLQILATKLGQSNKLTCILEDQMKQLERFKEQENKFLQDMRKMKSQFESKEFVSKQFELFNSDINRKMDRSNNPVLPNFYINLKIADSLSNMSKVQFSEKFIDQAQDNIQTEMEIINDQNYMLDTIKLLKDVQSTFYIPVSMISNSRNNHQLLIQKILGSQREVATNFFEEKTKKIYEGDLIGFLDKKKVDEDIVILTTPGLDDTPSKQKFEAEINSFQKLRMNIKDFKKKNGDIKGYSKKLKPSEKEQKEDRSQLMTIFQLMKKAIMCFYLICQSKTIFVVLQDNEQDFALYQQIKLICSNFLGAEKQDKEINFIHFYSQISDIKSEKAEFQFQKIKAKFNFKDTSSDFKNEKFMKFEEEEQEDFDSYYRNKLGQNIQFYHLMVFGSFESNYNEQLFEKVKKDIKSTKCKQIVPNQIEQHFKKNVYKILTYFFEFPKEQENDQQENQVFQFKEIQKKVQQQQNEINDDYDFDQLLENQLDWKDLVFYPFSFLTPNPINQQN
ncbi:hypothetical protein TTHERM_00227360 (macronuclear) [Tetrahymena thermophila SB210]|uniref:Uncharacterized protein n=1 Tax=Tetrahymena thermophila (strain SB210) TaxID=312017 RepID=Q23BU6_TETTS|nr:hypothetical protein TTHERM_00227360 [Tetrahymena thermophila SB210]EAR94022.2 hypothetical protein TTHERM_00227360 [Tetrahymena thermophila SB210]|eukprot:XP_001014267.2 hypothetical protein TTHERM_00227360 [Tetrahymena thermophila SB210]